MKRQLIPTLAGLLILLALGWYIDHIAHDEIAEVVRLVLYLFTALCVSVVVGFVIFSVLIVRERLLKERANRKLAEREATVMVITAGEGDQVYIRDADQGTTWRNAHLDVRVYANRQRTMPSQVEVAAWQTYTLRHRSRVTGQDIPQLLPPQTQVDLLAALDTVQRCLIVGASDSGKTTLLQWLVSRRLQTSKVVVIDPHAYPDKWPGCVVVGTGRNYPEIDQALEALVRLMTKRYDEIGKGIVAEQGHTRITILIDEWRAIVHNIKGASEAIKALLTESRKSAFSVFVASHSDRAKPLGLEGEYDLKDGFAVVQMGRDYAAEKGYQVMAEYAEDDRGASGYEINLPELNKIRDSARNDEFEVLIVREMDRLSRNLAKQLIIEEELKRYGVRIEYVLAEYDDTPEGRLSKHIRATIAEYEREKIKERAMRGKYLSAQKGNVLVFNRVPYGYRKVKENGKITLELVESEAAIVRLIFQWYVVGDESGTS